MGCHGEDRGCGGKKGLDVLLNSFNEGLLWKVVKKNSIGGDETVRFGVFLILENSPLPAVPGRLFAACVFEIRLSMEFMWDQGPGYGRRRAVFLRDSNPGFGRSPRALRLPFGAGRYLQQKSALHCPCRFFPFTIIPIKFIPFTT